MSKPVPRSVGWTDDPAVDRILDVLRESVHEIRSELGERRAVLDRENPSGERTRGADQFADELLAERLLDLDAVATYATEERAGKRHSDGRYHVAMDPLDGSSNLVSNNPMGTIVGVYDRPLPAAGRDLVAAAYVLYGPNTTMTVADGETVTEYLLADERRLLREDLQLPEEPTVYGVGGRRPDWPPAVTAAVDALESDRLKLRYGGALIADVTQVLTHGGLFAYPALAGRPDGKLRYQFECAPMGYVVETAGGRVSNGRGSLLDAEPDELHERTPFYAGDGDLVEEFERRLS